jgi:tRNA dimethylallyltransferase
MTIKNTKAPIIFLMGPTASGKTALAIELYQQGLEKRAVAQSATQSSGFEIISVDSAMVYSQMNIGSAKPSDKELVLAPHHLIDFIDPRQSYSSPQFCADASSLINDIHQRGKVPLLVGGTMLYFKALKDGLSDLPATDETIRQQVKAELESKGLEYLHQQLAKFDPQTAERLHVNDSQRITRAVEVYYMTGKPLSLWHAEQKQQALVNPLLSIALAPQERIILHQRIELRFEQMLEAGFLDEVANLYYRGDLSLDCPSMRSVGYRQIWQYMDGELSLSEAQKRAVIATRQLAKRQYTWLRSWPDILWFDPTAEKQLLSCKQTIDAFIASH